MHQLRFLPDGDTSARRRGGLHEKLRTHARAAVSAFRLMENSIDKLAERQAEQEDITRFDLLADRKDHNMYPVRSMTVSQLNMTVGGVLRKDRRIHANTYLTESLEKHSTRFLLLPVGRFHAVWQYADPPTPRRPSHQPTRRLGEALVQAPTEERIVTSSCVRVLHRLLIFMLVMYTAVMTPIQLCFDDVPATTQALVAFDVFTDLIFLTDVVVNFHTACARPALTL